MENVLDSTREFSPAEILALRYMAEMETNGIIPVANSLPLPKKEQVIVDRYELKKQEERMNVVEWIKAHANDPVFHEQKPERFMELKVEQHDFSEDHMSMDFQEDYGQGKDNGETTLTYQPFAEFFTAEEAEEEVSEDMDKLEDVLVVQNNMIREINDLIKSQGEKVKRPAKVKTYSYPQIRVLKNYLKNAKDQEGYKPNGFEQKFLDGNDLLKKDGKVDEELILLELQPKKYLARIHLAHTFGGLTEGPNGEDISLELESLFLERRGALDENDEVIPDILSGAYDYRSTAEWIMLRNEQWQERIRLEHESNLAMDNDVHDEQTSLDQYEIDFSEKFVKIQDEEAEALRIYLWRVKTFGIPDDYNYQIGQARKTHYYEVIDIMKREIEELLIESKSRLPLRAIEICQAKDNFMNRDVVWKIFKDDTDRNALNLYFKSSAIKLEDGTKFYGTKPHNLYPQLFAQYHQLMIQHIEPRLEKIRNAMKDRARDNFGKSLKVFLYQGETQEEKYAHAETAILKLLTFGNIVEYAYLSKCLHFVGGSTPKEFIGLSVLASKVAGKHV